MLVAEPKSLLRKLNPTCTRALETAASACISSRHYEVTVEHVLLSLLDDRDSDIVMAFEHYKLDPGHALGTLQRYMSDLRSGNAGKPVFSQLLFEWLQDAWIYASTELVDTSVRSRAASSGRSRRRRGRSTRNTSRRTPRSSAGSSR
jgi:type VI secretion system protein VasG